MIIDRLLLDKAFLTNDQNTNEIVCCSVVNCNLQFSGMRLELLFRFALWEKRNWKHRFGGQIAIPITMFIQLWCFVFLSTYVLAFRRGIHLAKYVPILTASNDLAVLGIRVGGFNFQNIENAWKSFQTTIAHWLFKGI